MKREDIHDAKLHFPLILLFWVPATLSIIGYLWSMIAWDILGDTSGVTEYYTSRFNSSMEANLWIINEMGVVPAILCCLLAISYLWMCRLIWAALSN